jgi:Peroxiredoxin
VIVHDPYVLPEGLPVPVDDGAADHLTGSAVPDLVLPSSRGAVNLRDFEVLYVYPRSGRPGRDLLPGWDDIPGARGCTPQSCAFRDSLEAFSSLGATVVGISTQTPAEQREFAEREHIPFALLSDTDRRLGAELNLPTFEVEGMTLYKRLTFGAEAGRIVKVFYPVFPPDRNAEEVLAWLAS